MGVLKRSAFQFYDHIESAVVFLDFFYGPMIREDPFSGLITAGHGYSRIDDIAVATGPGPFDDLYDIACLDQARPFHLECFCSHKMISSLKDEGLGYPFYYRTILKKNPGSPVA